MQQKKIIIFVAILFLASSAWLFRVNNKLLDLNDGKNWFAIYFINPKSADLDFAVDNHSDNAVFRYEVFNGNVKISEGEIVVNKGASKIIHIDSQLIRSGNDKTSLQVSSAGESREIYKNF
jgi:hypothetical protein